MLKKALATDNSEIFFNNNNCQEGKILLDEIRIILGERSSLNEQDDYNIEKCRDKFIQKLSTEEEVIYVLKQLEIKEIMLLSEVFEEI